MFTINTIYYTHIVYEYLPYNSSEIYVHFLVDVQVVHGREIIKMDVTVRDAGSVIGEPSSNSSLVCDIDFRIKTLKTLFKKKA